MEFGDLKGTVAAARIAVTAARWSEAIRTLDGCENWPVEFAEEAVLIKADAMTRRDAAAALAWLAATQDIVATDAARFQRELWTGRAYANVRNFAAAATRFERARSLAQAVPSGTEKLAYQRARLRWFQRDIRIDDTDLAVALADPDPHGRAAARILRGWIHTTTGDYASQIADFRTALAVYEETGTSPDVGGLSIMIHSLARVAFETADAEGVAAASRAYERLAWTDDVSVDHFQTLRALGWNAFMHGDAARAQWLFRDASGVAPTAAWQAMAHLDRSFVAQISRNEPWALDELAEAIRLAKTVAWGQTNGEERLALVSLAVLLAPVDTSQAMQYAATYSLLGTGNVNPSLALSGDRRGVGFEKFAFGRIEQMLGNRDTAQGAFEEAYEIFAPVNYHYQAMLAASALAEVTGEGAWATRAHAHLARYPGSPLAKRAPDQHQSTDPVLDGLPPLHRQIARSHWSGLNGDALSERFSRSRATIERHLAEIYAAFGVSNAAGLRGEALRRGLA